MAKKKSEGKGKKLDMALAKLTRIEASLRRLATQFEAHEQQLAKVHAAIKTAQPKTVARTEPAPKSSAEHRPVAVTQVKSAS